MPAGLGPNETTRTKVSPMRTLSTIIGLHIESAHSPDVNFGRIAWLQFAPHNWKMGNFGSRAKIHTRLSNRELSSVDIINARAPITDCSIVNGDYGDYDEH